MSNETLIAYENAEKQKNLELITTLGNTIVSLDQAIEQMNLAIASYDAQKENVNNQITEIESQNVMIEEIIQILSS